jgi:hypothetical protein
MNAVSFFVNVTTSYRNVFSSLETLFTRIFEVLQRVELYMRDADLVPAEMVMIAHEVLLKFLSICELSYRVLKGTNKFLMALRVGAFNDDCGIKDELESLERLEIREARMGIASNVVTTKAIQKKVNDGFTKTAGGLQFVKDSLQKAIGESEGEMQMNHIREKL